MMPLNYQRAASVEQAAQLSTAAGVRLLGGGTNLVDLMRKNVEQVAGVVDVSGLPAAIAPTLGGGLLIGAATKNSALAAHPLVRSRYPMLARAVLAGASPQIRNMATVGGNLLQRTRCVYFEDAATVRCNKRFPGSGCDAQGGFNRYHAVIGGSSACIATHPSDMCVALVALDAVVHIAGPGGPRIVAAVDFHHLPGERPDLETVVGAGDVVVAVELPPPPFDGPSAYRKVRDRASYAFALIAVAAGVEMHGDTAGEIRIAFGGLAPKPWRGLRAEAALRGQALTVDTITQAFEAEFAAPLRAGPAPAGAAFKIELARRTLLATLLELAGHDHQGEPA